MTATIVFDTADHCLYDTHMNVTLTPEIENWVQKKVESGLYQSASEVMREALRLLWSYEEERKAVFAQLHGAAGQKKGRRVPGIDKGLIVISEQFDDPLPEFDI